MSLNNAGANSLFSFNGQGLGGSDEITEQGLAGTINYYIGLVSQKEYLGFENAIISPNSGFNDQDKLTDDEALIIVNNGAIFGLADFSNEDTATKRKNIISYEIKPGDTPSSIAEYFNISTNTLLWANNLTLADATRIKAGDKLVILPIDGVRHVVKNNETVASIAKKYSADSAKILSFNGLGGNEVLEIGSILVIPGGKIPVSPASTSKPRTSVASVQKNTDLANIGNINTVAGDTHPPAHGRMFPWGQCTYYVALRRYVPWNGHAKYWLKNAKAHGFKTGSEPIVGAIVATTENPRYGHVAYVEAISNSNITISEMNYVGLGIKSIRVLPINSPVIKGYIYDAN